MKKRTSQPHLKLFKKSLLGVSIALAASSATAQDLSDSSKLEEVVVTGIRASLANALEEKRSSPKLVEVIIADDIGKLPDQNLAEVMENITGVQITRTAGVGTGVQIRGTNANRVEINGVATVGSGSGRSGIGFEDVNPAIIAAVEVTKAPDAKTVEGSVGGTVNLRTIRPLDLSETLGSIRVQGEDSSLSTEGIQPRLSGAYGDTWETSAGDFGFVISGSYTEQEALSFRPRADRDVVVTQGDNTFNGINFLLQEQENDSYETVNVASTFEWAPSDQLKFHADVIVNNQERSRDSYKIEGSGVGSIRSISTPDSYETVDFGYGLGEFQMAETGRLSPNLDFDDDDPNMRVTSETNARVTDTTLFSVGGEWQGDKLTASFEISSAASDTSTPKLNTTMNFINPNTPLDGGGYTVTAATGNDNAVPYIYDLSGGALAFGIDFDNEYAPTVADLLSADNYVLRALDVSRDTQENSDDQFRVDFSYTLEEFGITSIDAGLRFNSTSAESVTINDKLGNFSKLGDSPRASLFSDVVVPGPSNYGDTGDRELFVGDFLMIDADKAFSDPDGTIDIFESAFAANRALFPEGTGATSLGLEEDLNAYYLVEEDTTAFYTQANFEYGMLSGNIGFRYVESEIDSVAYGTEVNGVRSLKTTSGKYDFFLPRLNLTAQVTDDVVIRAAYGSDIRRPDFNDLNEGFTYSQSETSVLELGNSNLEPEEVDSLDLSVEWYFAPSAVASVAFFKKDRSNIITTIFNGAPLTESTTTVGGLERSNDPSCPGGGVWNPTVIPNTLGDPNTVGLCVDSSQRGNDSSTTTQKGVEMQVQYDLAEFEDSLGWASGFGFLANYTWQEFSGGSQIDETSGRGQAVLGDFSIPQGLLEFSENAYNITGYYEKHGLSVRMRYTWREAFRSLDFAGGASGSSTYSFPVVNHDRGQLNASVSYDVTDQLNIGVEAVNLTEEGILQTCVSETGPVCFAGYPDRRITFGASYRF
ncbi:TonB-dependent receptor [Gilvimarinus polysaccharolyticus]|uniref:TonB-dependent receptor n=1 Tax=Gilvimarinus polysaccharolyticus TaxID=863921 RepID=UPI0006734C14|nr:TonB-dependent receptor [Gilvimarinus polysaccharolyticus]